ncbi:MAG: restriction endonuclease subunit M [Bacteroidales bacterium]|nr:restriction endonuclease subunit M [Bacteroidales bacterium]
MDIDIQENYIAEKYPGILDTLLLDRTTKKNIFWATDSYSEHGDGFLNHDLITVEKITGENGMVIRPRALKSSEEQVARSKDKAEVFTPSWICNAQNNLVDNQWFGYEGAFNKETIDENGKHGWLVTEKVDFERAGKSWKEYVTDTRMEITCGEAPYLVSRYDTTTGEFIPVKNRIGLLDRKLRVICENAKDRDEWLDYAKKAYQNIYGYEWQGDNLILAREALFLTYIEYYQFYFGVDSKPNTLSLKKIADIISLNIWQMDGIKFVVPDSCHDEVEEITSLFDDPTEERRPCPGCACDDHTRHNGIYSVIRDWTVYEDYHTGKFGRKGCERSDQPFVNYVMHKNTI